MDTSRRRWVLPLLLVGVLAGVLAVRVWQPGATLVESNEAKPIEMSSRQLVELTIDNGEGKPQSWTVSWHASMTVHDALRAARARRNFQFAYRGTGAAAFLTKLAGLQNEGNSGRNWQFEINGKWSDRSFGIQTLEPGDHVLWKFAASE